MYEELHIRRQIVSAQPYVNCRSCLSTGRKNVPDLWRRLGETIIESQTDNDERYKWVESSSEHRIVRRMGKIQRPYEQKNSVYPTANPDRCVDTVCSQMAISGRFKSSKRPMIPLNRW